MREDVEENYLNYLNKHIRAVQKAYQLLASEDIIQGSEELSKQIEMHDKSKFGKEEFEVYAENFFGTPNKKLFKAACERHQKANPHHWEYWVKDGIPVDIPDNYIIEMVCDWLAFSLIKGDLKEIQRWYDGDKEKQNFTDSTRDRVENLLGQINALSQKQALQNQKENKTQ